MITMSVNSKDCSVCGVRLTAENTCRDNKLCKNCFSADMAGMEAEDLIEDSFEERLAEKADFM